MNHCIVRSFACLTAALVVACSQPNTGNQAGNQTAPSTVTQPASGYDGTYVFDAEKFKEELKTDDNLKNVPPDLIEKMLEKFNTFQIEIKGEDTTVSFGSETVKGRLKVESQEASEVKLLMTPSDEDKKNDTAFYVIQGSKLVVDPGKSEEDKLYFVKK